MENNKNKLFYGWIVVFSGLLVISISVGIIINGFSLYIKPIVEDMGVERSSIAFSISLAEILIMIISFFSGKIYSKINFLKLFKISSIILPLAYLCFSFCHELWQLYLVYIFIGIFSPLMSVLPLSIFITNWFNKSRATALGLCYMGSGIGGMAFTFIGNIIMEAHGWRFLALYTSVFMAVVLIPIAFLIMKEKPETLGLEPYGGLKYLSDNSSSDAEGLTVNESVHSIQFIEMLVFSVITGFNATIICTNVVTHIGDVGYSSTYAAALASICMGAIAVGKILFGKVTDSIGIKITSTVSCVAIALALLGLRLAIFKPFHLLIIFGNLIGSPVATVAYPCLIQKIFGKKSYVEINGFVVSGNYLGVAFSPLLSNYIYDRTGSYNNSFIIGIALCIVATLICAMIKSKLPEKSDD